MDHCILTEFKKICASWKTDSWLWFRIFLTDMIIYQARRCFNILYRIQLNFIGSFEEM